jgi:hypothetical protein
MGNVNGSKRVRQATRRRTALEQRRARFRLESLERRELLTNTPPNWAPTTTNLADVQHGPMANEGPLLIQVYQDYQRYIASGQSGNFATSSFNSLKGDVRFLGDSVDVTIYYYGDYTTYLNAALNLGLQITLAPGTGAPVSVSTTSQVIEGA